MYIVNISDLELFPIDTIVDNIVAQKALYRYNIVAQNKNNEALVEVLGDVVEFENSSIPFIPYSKQDGFFEINGGKTIDWKWLRSYEVDRIIVTIQNGKQFDGDEVSQNRMNRAIVRMSDTDNIGWKLADNTFSNVTKSELLEAIDLAGSKQLEIWQKYN